MLPPNNSVNRKLTRYAGSRRLPRAVGRVKTAAKTVWPSDADGDVLKRIVETDFDFEAIHSLNFNVDFEAWPPPPEFISLLRQQYPDTRIYEPEKDSSGYILIVVKAKLSYELVVFMQSAFTELAAPFGGPC